MSSSGRWARARGGRLPLSVRLSRVGDAPTGRGVGAWRPDATGWLAALGTTPEERPPTGKPVAGQVVLAAGWPRPQCGQRIIRRDSSYAIPRATSTLRRTCVFPSGEVSPLPVVTSWWPTLTPVCPASIRCIAVSSSSTSICNLYSFHISHSLHRDYVCDPFSFILTFFSS